MAEPPSKDRQSAPVRAQALPPLTEAEKAVQEAANTLLQYDRTVELINEANQRVDRFRLYPHVIQDLNRICINRLESDAGRWRDVPMRIGGSSHTPPPPEEVPRHIDEMCEYVNDNWGSRSALHLAAFVMWRLNWIHPFIDGNGRTTRAVSYYALCAKLNFHIPGVMTIPEMITKDKGPYYAALEGGDKAWEQQHQIDVSEMEELLGGLLARQMVLAVERAKQELPDNRRVGSRETLPVGAQNRDVSSRSDRPDSSFLVGAAFGALALIFFMALVLLSVAGLTVPDGARYLVVIVVAFSGALATGFLGGKVSGRGSVPITTTVAGHDLKFSVTGGVATLIILLLLGAWLFK